MKKIINGKLYDTATAKEIGSRCNSFARNDFSFCEEVLYKKKTREYFLYGHGGPLSKYAHNIGWNEVEGSSKIIPLTNEEARLWVEKNLSVDTYISEFGSVLE